MKLTFIVGPPRAGKTQLAFSGRFRDHRYFPHYFIRNYCRRYVKPPKDIGKYCCHQDMYCRTKKTTTRVAKCLFSVYNVTPQYSIVDMTRADSLHRELEFFGVLEKLWRTDHILIEGEYISKKDRFGSIILAAKGLGRKIEVVLLFAKPSILIKRCDSVMRKDRYGKMDDVMLQDLYRGITEGIFCTVSDLLPQIDSFRQVNTGKGAL